MTKPPNPPINVTQGRCCLVPVPAPCDYSYFSHRPSDQTVLASGAAEFLEKVHVGACAGQASLSLRYYQSVAHNFN